MLLQSQFESWHDQIKSSDKVVWRQNTNCCPFMTSVGGAVNMINMITQTYINETKQIQLCCYEGTEKKSSSIWAFNNLSSK